MANPGVLHLGAAFILAALISTGSCQQKNSTVKLEGISGLRTALENYAVNDSLADESTLRRFLDASNNRVSLAAERLQRTSDWRNKNEITRILAFEPSEIVNNSLPYTFTGFSNEGNPVIYYPLGLWRIREIRRQGKAREVTLYVNQLLERALESTKTARNPRNDETVTQVVFIVDMGGLNFREFVRDKGAAFFTHSRLRLLHDDHYPRLVKKWYFVRVPKTFRAFWSVYRKLLPRSLRGNIEVFARNSRNWQQVLQANIPKEAIPAELGGSFQTNFAKTKSDNSSSS